MDINAASPFSVEEVSDILSRCLKKIKKIVLGLSHCLMGNEFEYMCHIVFDSNLEKSHF